MEAGGASIAQRLEEIHVAVRGVRQRARALRDEEAAAAAGPRGAQQPRGPPADHRRLEIQAALGEANKLMAQLRPMAALAAELKVKWERQKQDVMGLQKQAIEAQLAERGREARERTEREFQEQLSGAVSEHRQWREAALASLSAQCELELRAAAGQSVRGADLLPGGLVDAAVRGAVREVAEWVAEEEPRIIQHWTEVTSDCIQRLDELDEELVADAQVGQVRALSDLQGALSRHQDALLATTREMQASLELAQDAPTAPAARRVVRRSHEEVQRRSVVAVNAGLEVAERRLEEAVSEAQAARERQRQRALERLDDAAKYEARHAIVYKKTATRIGPGLQADLAARLRQLAEEGRQRLWSAQADAPGQGGRGGCGGRGAGPRLPGRRQGSPPRSGFASPGSPAGGGPASEASADAGARTQKLAEAKLLRESLVRGDWGGTNWRLQMSQACEGALASTRGAEDALAAQGELLRRGRRQAPEIEALVKPPKEHLDGIAAELARVRDARVGLAMARREGVEEAIAAVQSRALDAESGLLPAMSRLAAETEAMLEVGRPLERPGADAALSRVPAGVVAGAWRRALSATFAVLLQLWEHADVPEAQQAVFARRVLAVIDRSEAGRRVLREA